MNRSISASTFARYGQPVLFHYQPHAAISGQDRSEELAEIRCRAVAEYALANSEQLPR